MEVFQRYQRMCGHENTKFIISCDKDDPSFQNPAMEAYFRDFSNTTVIHGDNSSKIEAVNADMDDVDFDICLLASDDMYPEVDGFGSIIVSCMKEFFPDTDGVLWFNDGIQGSNLNTLSILGKKYYDRFGYIYHPSYKSLWCDREFTDVLKKTGKYKYFNDIIIRHRHHSVPSNETSYDLLYLRNERLDQEDKKTFLSRESEGFPN